MKKLSDECCVPVNYELAEKLYRLGFRVGTPQCITRFDSEFVYDGDPGHPESHRIGEIRMYDFYHKNSVDEPGLFECPTVEMLSAWLLMEHGIHVSCNPHRKDETTWDWYYIIMTLDKQAREIRCNRYFDTHLQALMAGVNQVVDELLRRKMMTNEHPEHFY